MLVAFTPPALVGEMPISNNHYKLALLLPGGEMPAPAVWGVRAYVAISQKCIYRSNYRQSIFFLSVHSKLISLFLTAGSFFVSFYLLNYAYASVRCACFVADSAASLAALLLAMLPLSATDVFLKLLIADHAPARPGTDCSLF